MPIDINLGTKNFTVSYTTGTYVNTVTGSADQTVYGTGLIIDNILTSVDDISTLTIDDFLTNDNIRYSVQMTNDGILQLDDYVEFAYVANQQVNRVKLIYNNVYVFDGQSFVEVLDLVIPYDQTIDGAINYLCNLIRQRLNLITTNLTTTLDGVVESLPVKECILRTLVNRMKNDTNNIYSSNAAFIYSNWSICYNAGIIKMNMINQIERTIILNESGVDQIGLNAFKDIAGYLLSNQPGVGANIFNFRASFTYGQINQLNDVDLTTNPSADPNHSIVFDFISDASQ